VRAQDKRTSRIRRHRRVRRKVSGTAQRPRLAVFRSNRHIYAQLIDDGAARTLASASDATVEQAGDKVARAKRVGQALAGQATAAGITRAVFDRGGRLYHGRVKALADGAREGGLEI
jgi:large subunit ribosomal protein L18